MEKLKKVGSSNSVEKSLGEVERRRLQRYSHQDLISFTKNFSSQIGSGAYGDVFKGQFPDGVKVAVKRLKNIATDVEETAFMAEVKILSSTSHRNLVRLYGYCFEAKMKALVYEYLENGSLDTILYEKRLTLKWDKLYRIAIDTAKGLSYLHESCPGVTIVHYDVKAGNVLLDKNLLPKVADFGLAKVTKMDSSHISLIAAFRGTRNYAAPEMWMQLPVTCKSDIYSFGMMLFEILGRRRNRDDQNWFPGEVWAEFAKEKLDKVFEDCGIEDKDKKNARTLTTLALWCTQHTPDDRPSMSQVVQVLMGDKELPSPPNPLYPYSVSSSTSSRGGVSTKVNQPDSSVASPITVGRPYEDKIQAKKDNLTHNKEQQDVREEFTKENPKKERSLPIVEPSAKESMSQGVDSHVFWVLGHKTANVRDLFKFGRKLGQGQIGSTYLCIENSTGIEYACKSIQKRKLFSKEDVEDVRREVQIMHHLSGHKYIVSIKGAYEDSLYVHIVMELCAGGTLYDHIIQRGRCSERKAAELTRIIVGVVETCHSLGVMHRDLKPENFMLVCKDDDISLKAIDFGLSVFFKPGQFFTDVVGSPYYVAPEVLFKRYGPEADMWSAGVVLYMLLSGVLPFWAETQPRIFDMILRGVIDFESDPWPLISDSAKDLLRKMLCSLPSERFTVHEVLCHPWLCKNGVAPDRAKDPAVLSCLKQFSAMNKLKRMAVRVIAESLSEEEIAGWKQMFKVMDTDNSGAITFNELKAGLRRYGYTLNESEIRDLMEAADVDNSGTIDYGEFLAATVHRSKLEREEHLVTAFAYFDKSRSGYITFDELRQACLEHNMSNVYLADIISEVDQDNDGRIDYGEFVAMMTKGNEVLED